MKFYNGGSMGVYWGKYYFLSMFDFNQTCTHINLPLKNQTHPLKINTVKPDKPKIKCRQILATKHFYCKHNDQNACKQ